MPFGVKNAPAVFQEMMEGLFRDCSTFCSPYMDDLVIFSSCWEDYVQHVRQVLDKLKTAGLTANPAKCHLGAPEWSFWDTWSGRTPCPYLSTGLRHWLLIPSHRPRRASGHSSRQSAFIVDTLNFKLKIPLSSPLSPPSWLPPRLSGLRSVSQPFHPYVCILLTVVHSVFLSWKTSSLLSQMPRDWELGECSKCG